MPQADPHQVLWARAESRAFLIREGAIIWPLRYFYEFSVDVACQIARGQIDHHQGVDALYETAVHAGLVAELGDGGVQVLLDRAFRLVPPAQTRRAAA